VGWLLNGVGDLVMKVKNKRLSYCFFTSVFTGKVYTRASLKGRGDQGTFLMT